MTVAHKAAALARSRLFTGSPPEALDSLAHDAEFRLLDLGEMLFLEGEPARGLFIIVSGSIRAFRVNARGPGTDNSRGKGRSHPGRGSGVR
jgi:CRP-like cAMP-binding protein